MRFPLIRRITSAFQSFVDPSRLPPPGVVYGSPQEANPFRDEIRTDQWIPPSWVGPLDLENDGRETDEMRRAFREFFRREPAFRSAVNGKVASIACLDVSVLPDDPKSEEDCRAADFVRWTVEKSPHGWDGLITKLLRPAILDGWAVAEKTFSPVLTNRKWGGLWGLEAVKSKNTANLFLRLDQYRNIVGIVTRTQGMRVYDPRKAIIFTHNELFENPFGQADSRSVFRACSLIEDAYKLWTISLKVASAPFMHGKTSQDRVKKLDAALRMARAGGYLVTPSEDDVVLLNLASATSFDAFEKKVNKLREEIYLDIRGSYLPFLQGNGTGGDSRGDSRMGKIASNDQEYLLAKAIGRCLTHQLCPDLVIPNFGRLCGMPNIVLGGVNWKETQDQLAVGKMLLNDFKTPISAQQLYHIAQWSPPVDDDDAILPPSDNPGTAGVASLGNGSLFGGLPSVGGQNPSGAAASDPTDGGSLQFSQMMPISSLSINPDRFQWREDADPITGAVPDRRIETYDPAKAQPLAVWSDPDDARVYVVDGHHSYDAAKRSGVKMLPVQFIDAEDSEAACRKGFERNFAAPGPPPRPGLVWKEETSRWVNPDKGDGSAGGHQDAAPQTPTTSEPGKIRMIGNAIMDTKVGRLVTAVEHKVAIVAHKTRDIANEVATQRGLSEQHREKLARTLAIADFFGGWVAGGVAGAVAGPLAGKIVSMTAPTVSALYLAYSTARDPAATWAAARKVVSDSSFSPTGAAKDIADAWKGNPGRHSNFAEFDLVGSLADLCKDGNSELVEFRMAVFLAGVSAGLDPQQAIELASNAPRNAKYPAITEQSLGLSDAE